MIVEYGLRNADCGLAPTFLSQLLKSDFLNLISEIQNPKFPASVLCLLNLKSDIWNGLVQTSGLQSFIFQISNFILHPSFLPWFPGF